MQALERSRNVRPVMVRKLPSLTVRELSQRLGVPQVTARRWLRTGRIPPLAQRAAEILSGDLGALNARWAGWCINAQGELCSPENWTYSPGDVMSLTFERARARTYAAKLRYSVQADFIEGRYVEPGETDGPEPDAAAAL